MEMNFCRRCGARLTDKSGGMFICDNNHTLFINAAPCVGIFFVTDDNQVMVSVRGIEPYKGSLDAFGGFVDENESFEEALVREVEEELGLSQEEYNPPQYLCSNTGVYPYDGEVRTIIGALFWTRLKPGTKPVASDDVAAIRYVPLKNFDLSLVGNTDSRAGIEKLQKIFVK